MSQIFLKYVIFEFNIKTFTVIFKLYFHAIDVVNIKNHVIFEPNIIIFHVIF